MCTKSKVFLVNRIILNPLTRKMSRENPSNEEEKAKIKAFRELGLNQRKIAKNK